MTKRTNRSIGGEEALDILFPDGDRDLTPDGYFRAISRIRKEDKALARKIDRSLRVYLGDRVFPRRKRQWTDSSQGNKFRMELLPENPHFLSDVNVARDLFRIPKGHLGVASVDSDEEVFEADSLEFKKTGDKKRFEQKIIDHWINVHTSSLHGQSVEESPRFLTKEVFVSAFESGNENLKSKVMPHWIRIGIEENTSNCALESPIDRITGKILKRHKLPSHIFIPVRNFILTENAEFIKELEPLDVEVQASQEATSVKAPLKLTNPDSYRIVISGIDEFIKKEDWLRIWNEVVRPHQAYLDTLSGSNPKGRRMKDLDRLKEFAPRYREMVQENLTQTELTHSLHDDIDQETIRRAMGDLRDLLKPS